MAWSEGRQGDPNFLNEDDQFRLVGNYKLEDKEKNYGKHKDNKKWVGMPVCLFFVKMFWALSASYPLIEVLSQDESLRLQLCIFNGLKLSLQTVIYSSS